MLKIVTERTIFIGFFKRAERILGPQAEILFLMGLNKLM
jgi:hypothetical protein